MRRQRRWLGSDCAAIDPLRAETPCRRGSDGHVRCFRKREPRHCAEGSRFARRGLTLSGRGRCVRDADGGSFESLVECWMRCGGSYRCIFFVSTTLRNFFSHRHDARRCDGAACRRHHRCRRRCDALRVNEIAARSATDEIGRECPMHANRYSAAAREIVPPSIPLPCIGPEITFVASHKSKLRELFRRRSVVGDDQRRSSRHFEHRPRGHSTHRSGRNDEGRTSRHGLRLRLRAPRSRRRRGAVAATQSSSVAA